MTCTVAYSGPPALASAFAQMLREQGLEVDYTPPLERRGAETDAIAAVIGFAVNSGGQATIALVRAAVDRFRARFGDNATITLDDWQPPVGEATDLATGPRDTRRPDAVRRASAVLAKTR
jgi:hypothetical protein